MPRRGTAHEHVCDKVRSMSDDRVDPSGSTEAFKAFAASGTGAQPEVGRRGLGRTVALVAVLAVLVVVAVVWLVTTS